MSNLKEIRGRIASVRSTLKITSAMRLISSAKLRSTQNAANAYLPYLQSLDRIFGSVITAPDSSSSRQRYCGAAPSSGRLAVIVVTSNQSLCGSFNVNVMKCFQAQGYDPDRTRVYAVGKYGMKAVGRLGFADVVDCCRMARRPLYSSSAALAARLTDDFLAAHLCRVEIVHSHMVSNSTQTPSVLTFLPFDAGEQQDTMDGGLTGDVIFEPSAPLILDELIPRLLRARLHSVLLDCAASEHAARTLAMQIASDNAEQLLAQLSLTYNKLRQQAITNELLDLVGGQIDK